MGNYITVAGDYRKNNIYINFALIASWRPHFRFTFSSSTLFYFPFRCFFRYVLYCKRTRPPRLSHKFIRQTFMFISSGCTGLLWFIRSLSKSFALARVFSFMLPFIRSFTLRKHSPISMQHEQKTKSVCFIRKHIEQLQSLSSIPSHALPSENPKQNPPHRPTPTKHAVTNEIS